MDNSSAASSLHRVVEAVEYGRGFASEGQCSTIVNGGADAILKQFCLQCRTL
jgi:hypothetical protein